MSNIPIIPIVPGGAGLVNDNDVGDEESLPVNDEHLDDGETNDSEATVDEDVREADDVNEKLEE
jgi:hypothetical protein